MPYCEECGSEVSSEARFCKKCGASLILAPAESNPEALNTLLTHPEEVAGKQVAVREKSSAKRSFSQEQKNTDKLKKGLIIFGVVFVGILGILMLIKENRSRGNSVSSAASTSYSSVATKSKEAKWNYIGKNESQTVFVDTASIISSGSNGPKEAWFRFDFDPPNCKYTSKCQDKSLAYIRIYNNKTKCNLRIIVNFTDGTNAEESYSCDREEIEPNSFGEGMWKYLYR